MSRIKPYSEAKYVLNAGRILELLALLKPLVTPDKHAANGCYETLSVYYDTHDLEFLHDKIDGLTKKTKVRARFYRNSHNPDWHHGRLEVKKREGNLVTKLQTPLSDGHLPQHCLTDQGDQARDLLLHSFPDHADLLRFIARRFLTPALVIRYQRRAFFFPGLDGLRITCDTNIVGAQPTSATVFPLLSEHNPVAPVAAAQCRQHIFEIKSYAPPPAALLRQLELRGIQQQSFSKYASLLLPLLERTNDPRWRG